MADVQAVLEALSSPVRREILWLIWDEELPAGAIAAEFEVTAPTISSHLAVLREAGLVSMTREGTFRRYRARKDVLQTMTRLLDGPSTKWLPTDAPLPTPHEPAATSSVVRHAVHTDLSVSAVYRAFTVGSIYSRWLGASVTIRAQRFACTMPNGRVVRGTYDVLAPPNLIAMRWDFATDEIPIPIPDHELVGYLRFSEDDGRTRVEVQQFFDTAEQQLFVERVWTYVLDRFRDHAVAAIKDTRTRAK